MSIEVLHDGRISVSEYELQKFVEVLLKIGKEHDVETCESSKNYAQKNFGEPYRVTLVPKAKSVEAKPEKDPFGHKAKAAKALAASKITLVEGDDGSKGN